MGKSAPCQVIRDSKLRVVTPGVQFTDKEKVAWRRQTLDFFMKRRAPTPQEQKNKDKHERFTVPRLATYDWLVAVDNSLRGGTGSGLERFANTDASLQRGEVPPTLVLRMDQHQLQWTGVYFLENGRKKICCLGIFDGFHRRHNDLWQAMNGSGMGGHFVCNMLELNMSYGPWQSSAWMRDLEDGSLDVSQLMDVIDPLLLRLWSSICDDLNYHEPEEQGPVARAKLLQDLPHMPVFKRAPRRQRHGG